MWIDACIFAGLPPQDSAVPGAYWVPLILQSIGLIMLNVVDWAQITGGSFGNENEAMYAKCWITWSFIMGFSALAGSVWILIDDHKVREGHEQDGGWLAVAGLLSNLLVMISAIIFRFIRTTDEHTF